MPTGYSRVTVVSDSRRVDVALPAALPITDLLPQLLRLCSPAQPGAHQPVSWSLVRFNGTLLQPEASLAESGVVDGEVLELRGGQGGGRPAYVEDVRDAVEDVVDGSGRLWRSAISLRFALIAASLGLAALLVDPAVRAADDPAALGLAAVVAIALCGAGWWAGTRGEAGAGRLAILVGCLWAGLAGWLGVLAAHGSMGLAGGVALLSALVLAALVRIGTPLASGHVTGFAVAGAVGLAAGVVAVFGWPLDQVVRIAPVLLVIFVGALPRLSLSVGGLASADYLVRSGGQLPADALTERIARSGASLIGAMMSIGLLAAIACVRLAMVPSLWDRGLGILLGVALLLRSRAFSQVWHVLPLRVAGVVALVAQGYGLVSYAPQLRVWVPLAGALVAVVFVLISAVRPSDIARARIKRVLDWVERLVVAALIPICAGAVGAYALAQAMLVK
ncbi:type VII secretion integral membrane protein EccD [Fodinicola acaciae]|uniref:type VII secretion integral membrane protein EccD n=1 Tax=Fodinicola acaciae TaxID=2681555 RepID=UPI0013D19EF5|nr:type VII secretion integral membrane protein EccD [Fodinicola acaciae]